jgi:hypothetical protein
LNLILLLSYSFWYWTQSCLDLPFVFVRETYPVDNVLNFSNLFSELKPIFRLYGSFSFLTIHVISYVFVLCFDPSLFPKSTSSPSLACWVGGWAILMNGLVYAMYRWNRCIWEMTPSNRDTYMSPHCSILCHSAFALLIFVLGLWMLRVPGVENDRVPLLLMTSLCDLRFSPLLVHFLPIVLYIHKTASSNRG